MQGMKIIICYSVLLSSSIFAMEQKIERKPKVQCKTDFSKISIQFAAGKGNLPVVKEWLQHEPTKLNEADKRGETALHWSASMGHESVVDFYLSSKVFKLIRVIKKAKHHFFGHLLKAIPKSFKNFLMLEQIQKILIKKVKRRFTGQQEMIKLKF